MLGISAGLAGIFNQFGQLGQGFSVYLFKTTEINSCQSGKFWVLYADEQYDYQTPIPGCD